jgi:hypothetical protein
MERTSPKNRILALSGTLLFHGLIILFFFLWVIKTPIPPYPDTGTPGLEVNLGLSEDGMGDLQPEEAGDAEQVNTSDDVIVQPITNNQAPAFKSTEAILSQETEEAPTTAVVKEKPAESNNPAPKEIVTETPQKKVNAKALFPGKSGGKKGGNEGETGKPGDQGDPDGSRTSKYHGPGGSGGNTVGDGDSDKGKGISYTLNGRTPQALIAPKSNVQEEGIVVVEITVDKKGVIIYAKPGAKGSTTSNSTLLEIARKAALGVRFNPDPDAPEEQKGKIIYNFTLR